MDMDNIVTLYDEDNNPSEFEIIDIFELGDSTYAGVTPYKEEFNINDEVEVYMLKIIEQNNEEIFTYIEDETEEQNAYNELVRRDAEMEDEDEIEDEE